MQPCSWRSILSVCKLPAHFSVCALKLLSSMSFKGPDMPLLFGFVVGINILAILVDSKAFYFNGTTPQNVNAKPLPCSSLISYSQTFSDVQTVVDCRSTTSDVTAQLKTQAPGQEPYFNPLELDPQSVLWECVARLTFIKKCVRFNAWAAPGHEVQVCGGAHRCQQCRWVGVEFNVAMSSEQCLNDAPDGAADKTNTTISVVPADDPADGPANWNCFSWHSEPC